MDEQMIKKRIEEELWKDVSAELKPGPRKTYELKLKEWQYRYLATRSIKGLMETGNPDPEVAPLSDPFPGCSDIGHPISMTLIQELVPNIMAAMMGTTPYTETKLITDKGLEPGGDIDDFLYYALERENVKSLRRKTVVSAYKYGEGIEKLVFVPEERTISDERLLLMTTSKKPKILFDAEGEMVEIFDPEKDLKEIFREMLQGEDPRSEWHRHCLRGLKLSPDQALQAAGFDVTGEVGEQSARVAPLEQGPAGQPMADWGNSTTYYPTLHTVTETIVVSNWPKFVKVPTKDFLWPSDAKTNDLMDYWCGSRYRVDLEWLEERKKESDKDPEGFYPEVVDRIVAAHLAMGRDKDNSEDCRPEIYEIYSKFVLNKDDKKKEDYLQEVEIIAWFYAGDEVDSKEDRNGECLGWMVNPANRYDIHHIKPYFMFQVKPEDEGFHGLCIPESCTGVRNAADWELNERLNRAALAGNPAIVVDEDTFGIEEQDLTLGLGKVLIKARGGDLDVLNMDKPESNSVREEESMMYWLRLLWGANEQMSGQKTNTDSGTATEANLIAAKGARMFQDTVESLSQTADLQYAYIRQYFKQNEPTDMKVPGTAVEGKEGSLIEITRKMFEPPMLIKSRRVATEAEREMTIGAIKEGVGFLANIQSPLMRNPTFLESAIKTYFDALNLESIEIPTKEQLMQEQAAMMAMAKQMEEKESFEKHAEKIPNKGVRNQIQRFLENPREASKLGAPATSASQAPGMPAQTGQAIQQMGGVR